MILPTHKYICAASDAASVCAVGLLNDAVRYSDNAYPLTVSMHSRGCIQELSVFGNTQSALSACGNIFSENPNQYTIPLIITSDESVYHIDIQIPYMLNGHSDLCDCVTLDYSNQTALLTMFFKTIVLTGNEAWRVQSMNGGYRYSIKITDAAECTQDAGFAISSRIPLGMKGSTAYMSNTFVISGDYLYIRTNGTDTLDDFKEWLSEIYAEGQPLVVVYQLSEPVTTDISVLQDWNITPKLYAGENCITSDTSVAPNAVKIAYTIQ